MTYVSDKSFKEFMKLSDKEGIKYKSGAEARAAAENLIGLVDLLFEMHQDEQRRKQKLEDHPDGYVFEGEGRGCPLCKTNVSGDMWYDKWGQKCMDCHEAHRKKIIPGYVFSDSKNEKHITGSELGYKFDIKHMTMKKLVREGKLKARIVKGNNLYVFLKRDNPKLPDIIEEYLKK